MPTAATRYPQVTVTVDLDRLRRGLATAGTLDLLTGSRDGEPGALTAGQLRALACDAALIPAVLDGASLPLDLGRTRRVASTAQRAALALRDRGCVMPGCDAPPPGCTAHHITHWGQDGPTDLGNLALLCPAHHTQVHLQHWSLRVTVSGLVELTPPAWVDPDRLPRHHERHIGRNIALRA